MKKFYVFLDWFFTFMAYLMVGVCWYIDKITTLEGLCFVIIFILFGIGNTLDDIREKMDK